MIMETDRNRSLRVELSLASVQRDHAMRPNGASGGQNSGAAGTTAVPFQGCGGKEENHPDLGGGGGTIAPTTSRRIVLLVLGVWPAARGARSMRYPKGMAVRWSLGKPRCCVLRSVCAGNWHPTAVGLTGRTRTGTQRGSKSGKYATTHDCGCLWKLCALFPAFRSSP
ncbi:syntaxin binding protein, putative [Trypanosoma cruzi]|nr:syntaxin binding protein, putative [Trypanosoma cruzi]